MTSLILATAARFLFPLLLLFSVFLLLRGHNLPGGGFVGGLVAAAAFALYWLAFGTRTARRALRINPLTLIAAGLILAAGSGCVAFLSGRPFLTGLWVRLHVPVLGEVWAGTPLIFDTGVYLLVIGVLMLVITTLAEETREQP